MIGQAEGNLGTCTWEGDRPLPEAKEWIKWKYENVINKPPEATEFFKFVTSLSPEEKSKLLKEIFIDGKTKINL